MRNNNECINKIILLGTITKEPRWHERERERWLQLTLVTREAIFSTSGDFDHLETHQVRIPHTNPCLNRWELKKNDKLYIQGRITTESFVDGMNVRRYKTEIIALVVEKFNDDQRSA